MSARLDRLAELEQAATPGPWSYEPTGEKDNSWCLGTAVDENEKPIAGELEYGSEFTVVDFICESPNGKTGLTDAALIAESRNALPALIAAFRRLQEIAPDDPAVLTLGEEALTPPQDALREEIERATENGRLAQQHWDRAERAEAEVRRLREALREIAHSERKGAWMDGKSWRKELARAVLADDIEEEK